MKRLPRWLKISLLVVAVIVALALVAPYFLDADRYRGIIVSTLEKETGRRVSISKVQARLVPSVGFVIENFSIGNPPGFAEGNLLAVDAIRGSLAWGPLFRRQFELSAIELVHPRLTLLEDDRGRNNYTFEDKKKPAQAPGGLTFRVADIDSIELSDVEVSLGRVTGRKNTIVASLRAWNINAELGNVALDASRVKQWEADADLGGVLVEVPGLKGPIEVRSGDFRLREGKVESKFAASLGKAADVKGTVKVANVEKAVAVFTLSTPLLDIDQLGAAGAQTAPSAPARPQKSELVAQGRVTADRVRYAPYEATQGSVELRIFTDRVEAWPVSMGLYGGALQVSAQVDRRQSPERFSANIQANSVQVGKMLAASPGAREKITGTGEMKLQVFGSLGPKLLNSLTGSGNFAVRNGKLPGFSMSGALEKLAKVQQVLTFGAGSGGFSADTPFNSITGDLQIGGGRVASDRIHLDSPNGTVDLRGSFGFDQTLDYDGQAVLMRSATGGGANNPVGAITGVLGGVMKQTVGRISVPFGVRGTFENPKIMPGRGIPGIHTASGTSGQTTQTQATQEQPKKKKSIFDVFRRP